MDISPEELLHELARIDATMALAIRSAGNGGNPDLDRQLDAHARSLRVMLDSEGAAVADDAIDAAKRAMEAADPAAPLLMLAMARRTLSAVIRRQAERIQRHVDARAA